MSGVEYQVRWQRVGGTRVKVRRYQTLARALRWHSFLTSDPHSRCDHSTGYGEPPYCIWGETRSVIGDPPAWLTEPVIEVRAIGEWRPR